MKRRCVIIGAGLGGLSTGIILAKNGYEVTVLEQSSQIGGCLQCFYRDGAKFETGMHFIGSLDDGQILSNYFNFLEIKDKVIVNRMDDHAYDVVSFRGEQIPFANGNENFINQMSSFFPAQRDNLSSYCNIANAIARVSPYYSLKDKEKGFVIDGKYYLRSINEVLDGIISDSLLRKVLIGNLSLYAAEKGKTPFTTHAFVFDFYNNSAFRVVGGSDNIAKAMAEVIGQYNGRILTNHKVSKIHLTNGHASAVEVENSELFPADLVISDIHPWQLLQLTDIKAFTPAFKSRIDGISNTTSVFSLFLKFKDGTLPYMNSNFYGFLTDSPWEMDDKFDSCWPKGYLYMHHCQEMNQRFAKTGVILAYISADEFSQWSNTKANRRGSDYCAFKEQLAERLLGAVEKDFPNLRDSISSCYSASPLTYRDYTLTPDGAMYGMSKDVNLGIAGRIQYKTKVPNLLLVGQNINSHGMLGVLVGSITACEHVIGTEQIRTQMLSANL